jgi:hypothetical protein
MDLYSEENEDNKKYDINENNANEEKWLPPLEPGLNNSPKIIPDYYLKKQKIIIDNELREINSQRQKFTPSSKKSRGTVSGSSIDEGNDSIAKVISKANPNIAKNNPSTNHNRNLYCRFIPQLIQELCSSLSAPHTISGATRYKEATNDNFCSVCSGSLIRHFTIIATGIAKGNQITSQASKKIPTLIKVDSPIGRLNSVLAKTLLNMSTHFTG